MTPTPSPDLPHPPNYPPTISTALASEIRHFAGWTLSVNCPRCRMLRELPVDDLVRRVGAERLLGDVVPRLRCQTCGTEPSWVKLADGIEGTARVVRKVMLVG